MYTQSDLDAIDRQIEALDNQRGALSDQISALYFKKRRMKRAGVTTRPQVVNDESDLPEFLRTGYVYQPEPVKTYDPDEIVPVKPRVDVLPDDAAAWAERLSKPHPGNGK